MRGSRKRKNLKIRLVFITGLLAVFLPLILIFRLFTVNKIETFGDPSCDENSKAVQINNILGKNLFLVDKDETEKTLQKQNICIKKINLSKNFPDRVRVEFVKRQAKAVILNISPEATDPANFEENFIKEASLSAELYLDNIKREAFLVDEEGVIFSKPKDSGLLKIYSFVNVRMGQKMENNLMVKILKAVEGLKVFGIEVAASLLNSDHTYLVYSNPKVFFDLKNDLDLQLASLQLILRKAKINNNVTFIDLRFDKPVVKYAPNEQN